MIADMNSASPPAVRVASGNQRVTELKAVDAGLFRPEFPQVRRESP